MVECVCTAEHDRLRKSAKENGQKLSGLEVEPDRSSVACQSEEDWQGVLSFISENLPTARRNHRLLRFKLYQRQQGEGEKNTGN